VDGFHKRVAPWLRTLAPDADPKKEDLLALGAVRVPGNAGGAPLARDPWPCCKCLASLPFADAFAHADLVIWQRSLPHTGSINIGTAPRVVQYITMNPANAVQDEVSQLHCTCCPWVLFAAVRPFVLHDKIILGKETNSTEI
jgi:hypothetical protein